MPVLRQALPEVRPLLRPERPVPRLRLAHAAPRDPALPARRDGGRFVQRVDPPRRAGAGSRTVAVLDRVGGLRLRRLGLSARGRPRRHHAAAVCRRLVRSDRLRSRARARPGGRTCHRRALPGPAPGRDRNRPGADPPCGGDGRGRFRDVARRAAAGFRPVGPRAHLRAGVRESPGGRGVRGRARDYVERLDPETRGVYGLRPGEPFHVCTKTG